MVGHICTINQIISSDFTNWAWYRPGVGQFKPENIDPSTCTHVVYGFAILDKTNFVIASKDPWADVENSFYDKIVSLKRHGVKVSIAVGGWTDSKGDKYSKLVNDPKLRNTFVESVVKFIEQYGFDGLDLDWEFPGCWQVNKYTRRAIYHQHAYHTEIFCHRLTAPRAP